MYQVVIEKIRYISVLFLLRCYVYTIMCRNVWATFATMCDQFHFHHDFCVWGELGTTTCPLAVLVLLGWARCPTSDRDIPSGRIVVVVVGGVVGMGSVV